MIAHWHLPVNLNQIVSPEIMFLGAQIVLVGLATLFSCAAYSGPEDWKCPKRSKIQIILQFRNASKQIEIAPDATVGNLRRSLAKFVGVSPVIRFRRKVLNDDSATLEDTGLFTGATVQCDWHTLCGGGGTTKYIPVEKLEPLLDAIHLDFNAWLYSDDPKDADDKPLPKGPDGKPLLQWTGLSDDIQNFFKSQKIDPTLKYPEFYTGDRHTIATSYVWSVTSLLEMAGMNMLIFYFNSCVVCLIYRFFEQKSSARMCMLGRYCSSMCSACRSKR